MKAKNTTKRSLFLLSCVVIFLNIHITEISGQSLFVRSNTGTQTEYIINDIANLTFNSGELIVKEITGNTDAYVISDIRYINFDNLTAVIKNTDIFSTFNIYPNPVSNVLNISSSLLTTTDDVYTLQIVSVEGKLLHSEIFMLNKGENSRSLNIANMPKGIYICSLKNNKQVKTQKIIKL